MIELSKLQDRIMRVLTVKGGKTKEELIALLEKPQTTLSDNLDKLEKARLVKKRPVHTGRPGRPEIVWEVSNDE